jgi:hypothetical protein
VGALPGKAWLATSFTLYPDYDTAEQQRHTHIQNLRRYGVEPQDYGTLQDGANVVPYQAQKWEANELSIVLQAVEDTDLALSTFLSPDPFETVMDEFKIVRSAAATPEISILGYTASSVTAGCPARYVYQ